MPAFGATKSRVQLKDGAGKQLVEANCVMCHSLDYIPMNSVFLDRKGWEASVTKMMKVMGAPISEQDVAGHRRLSGPQLREIATLPMKTTFLEFEQPIAELEAKIDELRYVQEDSALDISEEIGRLQKKSNTLTKEIYAKLTPWQISQVARHPQRPYYARLHPERLHRFPGAARRPRLRRRSLDRRRAGPLRRSDRDGDRPSEGPRHQGEAVPQLRHAAPGGLSQGAAAAAPGREVRHSGDDLRRHARAPIPASARRSAASPRRSAAICTSWPSCACRSS